MISAKTKTAEALFPLLSVFHELSGLTLKKVGRGLIEDELVELEFDFESKVFLVRANGEDDTVDFWSVDAAKHKLSENYVGGNFPWETHVGKKFGWGWAVVNQQGYLDGILLSFEGITPQLLILVVASSLKVSLIEPPINQGLIRGRS